jgi:excisionase family DNA binding protein
MTFRTANPPRSPASAPASRGTGSARRGQPITKLLTIDEVAEVLNVSPRTVRRLIDEGALPVHRLGRLVRISDDDLAAFLAANRSA